MRRSTPAGPRSDPDTVRPVRLVTSVDVDDPAAVTITVSARHELELPDGRRVLLLDDRGWGSTQRWAGASAEGLRETTRAVVGPDEPTGGRTAEEMAAGHWTHLQQVARHHGAPVDADELRRLPHDVVLGADVLARIRPSG
ncbi:hypothetical protein H6H00_11185 [Pseudonocardia petroleophila]|uniref:Uncharacterized protein n=1 Tax=Pseudonocardia petroleophila TaxID=37331 RepID=A0A7G7MRX1_9PSEU|nr:hypothetical protein H6H00_11185 [Pseudonocardia petroleophila]